MSDGFIEIPANSNSVGHRRKVFGAGINDASYIVNIIVDGISIKCPYYTRWKSMLQRCYDIGYLRKHPSYINCIVCDDWLIFSNFKKWMEKQDWEGKALDKDLIRSGNCMYSPTTCTFISQSINNLLNTNKASRGQYPQGVSYDKPSGKYMSCIRVHSVSKTLGRFHTVGEASSRYKAAKATYLLEYAAMPAHFRIAKYLRRVASDYTVGAV